MARSPEHTSVAYRKKAIPEWLLWRLLEEPRRRLYARFERHFPPTPEQSVLDLGCNAYWDDPSKYFFESRYPYTHRVVAAGLETGEKIRKCFPAVEYRRLSRSELRLPFDDDAFDVVFCNAVIEHVGNRARQRMFLEEILRIGRAAYVTTPNRWYPVESHTALPLLHYLPSSVYRPLYRRLGFDFFACEENLNLLDRRQFLGLLPVPCRRSCHIETIRLFGMPSNLLLIAKS